MFIGAVTAVLTAGCRRPDADSRGGGKPGGSATSGGDKASGIDPLLARAVGRAIQLCILTHKSGEKGAALVYTAELGLVPDAEGVALASFVTPRHAAFEACAVKAINAARIPLAAVTTLPVAFDFRDQGAPKAPGQ